MLEPRVLRHRLFVNWVPSTHRVDKISGSGLMWFDAQPSAGALDPQMYLSTTFSEVNFDMQHSMSVNVSCRRETLNTSTASVRFLGKMC